MTATIEASVEKAVMRIRRWERLDMLWWRHLLDDAPAEAVIVARLALLLNAKPIEGEA